MLPELPSVASGLWSGQSSVAPTVSQHDVQFPTDLAFSWMFAQPKLSSILLPTFLSLYNSISEPFKVSSVSPSSSSIRICFMQLPAGYISGRLTQPNKIQYFRRLFRISFSVSLGNRAQGHNYLLQPIRTRSRRKHPATTHSDSFPATQARSCRSNNIAASEF